MSTSVIRRYCEDLIALDVNGFLSGRAGKSKLLQPGNEFKVYWAPRGQITHTAYISVASDHLIIQSLNEVESIALTRKIRLRLDSTPCNLGGNRTWLLCPRCSKRVAVLYGWDSFQCRTCNGAHFKSQSETTHDRALRRAGKTRRLLGWKPGVANPIGERPKGMHHRTYSKYLVKYALEEQAVIGGLQEWLASMRSRVAPSSS